MDSKLLLALLMVFGVMITIIAVVGFFVYKKIKATDLTASDPSLNTHSETAQSFLPFEDVRDSMINIGNHQYRAILECTSINYNLKTELEQNMIDLTYQRLLNSLPFKISIHVQTRVMDHTQMLENLRLDMIKTLETFPQLEEYATVYFDEMKHVYEHMGNNKEKRKYIIIPYDDAAFLSTASDDEKHKSAIEEMTRRCLTVIDGLQGIGIRAKLLNTPDLIDLLYACYHKNSPNQSIELNKSGFLSAIVDGDNKMNRITNLGTLEWVLWEAQKQLETKFINDNAVPDDMKEKAAIAIKKINDLRREFTL